MHRNTFSVLAIMLLGACSHQVNTSVKPALNVYSSYSDKIPETYALMIDASELSGDFKVTGVVCSMHTYPMNLSSSFEQSVVQTLKQVIDNVVIVGAPLTREQLSASKMDGIIRIIGDGVDVDLIAIPGFWTAQMEAEVSIQASLIVDGLADRLLGATVLGDGEERRDIGNACGGGADAMSAAAEDALEDVSRAIGERISNAPKIREQSTSRLNRVSLLNL